MSVSDHCAKQTCENDSDAVTDKRPNKVSSSSKKTPQKFFNPFEVGLDKLRCSSYFSPNIFSCSDKERSEASFRWSIDQLAALKPTDIDESSLQDVHGVDSETEELAQTAISEFFSKNKIAPSPWTSDTKEERFNSKPHHVTFSPNLASTAYYEHYEEVINSSNSVENNSKKTAWTQTVLSIPPNFDLENILSQFLTFNGNQQQLNSKDTLEIPDDIKEMNNHLSLRRKLFDHNDDPQERRNPRFMFKSNKELNPESPPISPFPVKTPPRRGSRGDNLCTPESSSPITPYYERKLSGNFPNFNALGSPAVSPIAKSAFKTPSTGSLRNEGIFQIPSTPSSEGMTPRKRSSKIGKLSDSDSIMEMSIDEESYQAMNPGENQQTDMTEYFESLQTDSVRLESQQNETDLNDDSSKTNHDTGYHSNAQGTSYLDEVSCSSVSIIPVKQDINFLETAPSRIYDNVINM